MLKAHWYQSLKKNKIQELGHLWSLWRASIWCHSFSCLFELAHSQVKEFDWSNLGHVPSPDGAGIIWFSSMVRTIRCRKRAVPWGGGELAAALSKRREEEVLGRETHAHCKHLSCVLTQEGVRYSPSSRKPWSKGGAPQVTVWSLLSHRGCRRLWEPGWWHLTQTPY